MIAGLRPMDAPLIAASVRWMAGAVLCALGACAGAATPVVYGRPSADVDRDASYPADLLALALARSGGDYELRTSAEPIPQTRAIRLLAAGEVIDVLWTVTSPERESALLPVRVPIDRGLYGWRLLLVRAGDQARFDAVHSLADLARLRAGQGHDWPDLAILRAAGLSVLAASSYDGLFEMLALGRIDYYPRALPEAFPELAQRSGLPLALEQGLLLHYPSAMYYFVSPHEPELARALERGLRAAFADGSLELLFEEHFGAALERARIGQRRVLHLANPLQPALARNVEPVWWLDLER